MAPWLVLCHRSFEHRDTESSPHHPSTLESLDDVRASFRAGPPLGDGGVSDDGTVPRARQRPRDMITVVAEKQGAHAAAEARRAEYRARQDAAYLAKVLPIILTPPWPADRPAFPAAFCTAVSSHSSAGLDTGRHEPRRNYRRGRVRCTYTAAAQAVQCGFAMRGLTLSAEDGHSIEL